MTPELSGTWRTIVREVREVSYLLLALFNLFLAYMTYRYGGGFGDWQAVVVIVVMLALAGLVMWLGLSERIRELLGRA